MSCCRRERGNGYATRYEGLGLWFGTGNRCSDRTRQSFGEHLVAGWNAPSFALTLPVHFPKPGQIPKFPDFPSILRIRGDAVI